MVQKPKKQDKQQLYNLWKTIFAYADGGSINYFFNETYNPDDFYLIKDEKEDLIVAGLLRDRQQLNLNGYIFEVSVLDNLFTLYKYRNQGIMHSLLQKVLKELEYSELFSLIKTSKAKDFKQYGFETIYYKKRYLVNRADLYNVDGYSISDVYKPNDLLEVYTKFISRFNGHLIRNEKMFKNYINILKASGKEIFVTRNADKEIMGYLVYNYVASELVVVEIVYLDSISLLTLLNQAMGMNAYIYVDVSENENLDKVIDNLVYEVIDYMMIRINDKELFKRLFNNDRATIKSIMKTSNRPLAIGYY
ncbi:MAG: GNAT family N-acetyltransferase [Erysipelothrix sp.]|nr:GNAT family N-acetyltransferase [Erysipelothrix sp.]